MIGRVGCATSAHPVLLSPSQGHSKSIQCLTVHKNGGKSYIYSGSHDGHINILLLGSWHRHWQERGLFCSHGAGGRASQMAPAQLCSLNRLTQLVPLSAPGTLTSPGLRQKEAWAQLAAQPSMVLEVSALELLFL